MTRPTVVRTALPTAALPIAAFLTAILVLPGCGGEHAHHAAPAGADTTYTVGATYLGPRFDSTAARVAHGDIPGVMPAMTMDLRVTSPAVLRGYAEGDSVRLTLEQRGQDLVIGALEAAADAPRP